jgi:GNAT superfamily N-acetyltransferase
VAFNRRRLPGVDNRAQTWRLRHTPRPPNHPIAGGSWTGVAALHRRSHLLHDPYEVSYYNTSVEIHPSARKHGIADADIEHAMRHALAIDDQDDDTRLYLGPAPNAELLEVVTIVRDDGSELAIHAMRMRPKYRRLLPEADDG